jgi:hypothetical protein
LPFLFTRERWDDHLQERDGKASALGSEFPRDNDGKKRKIHNNVLDNTSYVPLQLRRRRFCWSSHGKKIF